MIKDQRPLTLTEVSELIGDSEKSEKVKQFIKKFYSLDAKDAKKLKEELEALNLIKLKEENIVSLVNFLPKDASDIMKILNEVSLDQEEITKILDVVKKY